VSTKQIQNSTYQPKQLIKHEKNYKNYPTVTRRKGKGHCGKKKERKRVLLTSKPNLRKTPRGGRRMATMISTKVAVPIFDILILSSS